MKILWITPQLPCKYSGGHTRQYNLIKSLCLKNSITVLSLVTEAEQKEVQTLRDLGVEVIPEVFQPPVTKGGWQNRLRVMGQKIFDPWPQYARTYPVEPLNEHLKSILSDHKPDVIQFEHLFVAPLQRFVEDIPCVITAHNIEYLNFERQSKQTHAFSRRFVDWIELKKLQSWEQKWLGHFEACITVSDQDAASARKLLSSSSVYTIPNGVNAAEFEPPQEASYCRQNLLFFGNLGYPPNIDALSFFINRIFPLIQKKIPDITLNVVGPNAPAALVDWCSSPGINYIGFVEDVRDYLWKQAIVIAPLRSGGGTRLKILEALAAGCPVVSTSMGAEGLCLRNQQDLLIEDGPEEFADAVIRLYWDAGLRETMGKAGQQSVRQQYDWGIITPQLVTVYERVIHEHKGIK